MKKKYLQAFIESVDSGTYTLAQLYEEFKYFCEQNVIPKSSIAMFRSNLETLNDNSQDVNCGRSPNIVYDDNGIKIKLIVIT